MNVGQLIRGRGLRVTALAILVVLLAARFAIGAWELRTGATLLRASLANAAARDPASDFRAAETLTQVTAACAKLEPGAAAVQPIPWLLQPLAAVPRLRGWGELNDVLSLGNRLCDMASSAQPLTQMLSDRDPQSSLAATLLPRLHDREPMFRQLGLEAGAALAYEAKLRPDDFHGPLAALQGPLRRLATLNPTLTTIRDLGPRVPDLAAALLGADQPRTYLVLGQDNAELRATGGFVGVMGPLELSSGAVVGNDFRSSYDWDNTELPRTPAPPALEQYMNIGAWYLRDANWWPDFRRTAAQIETMWARSQSGSVDGVLAVDLHALDDLLAAVGGVDVPELGGVIEPGTAEQRIDQTRRASDALASYGQYQAVKTRLLGALYRALLQKLLKPTPEQVPRVAIALAHNLSTKHILLYFNDPVLSRAMGRLGWDGAVGSTGTDTLAIVDTSVSYGKLGPYLSKTASYVLGPDRSVSLDVSYTNRFQPTSGAPWDPYLSGEYWDWRNHKLVRDQGAWLDYIRLIVPAGSQLRTVAGSDDPPRVSDDATGFMTIGFPVLVRPGQTRKVQVTYLLPQGLPPGELKVIAQPGAPPYTLTMSQGSQEETLTVDGRDLEIGNSDGLFSHRT